MLNSIYLVGVLVWKSRLYKQNEKYYILTKVRIPNSNGSKTIVEVDCIAFEKLAKQLNFINERAILAITGTFINFNNQSNVAQITSFNLLSNNKIIDIDKIEEIYNPKEVTDFKN